MLCKKCKSNVETCGHYDIRARCFVKLRDEYLEGRIQADWLDNIKIIRKAIKENGAENKFRVIKVDLNYLTKKPYEMLIITKIAGVYDTWIYTKYFERIVT